MKADPRVVDVAALLNGGAPQPEVRIENLAKLVNGGRPQPGVRVENLAKLVNEGGPPTPSIQRSVSISHELDIRKAASARVHAAQYQSLGACKGSTQQQVGVKPCCEECAKAAGSAPRLERPTTGHEVARGPDWMRLHHQFRGSGAGRVVPFDFYPCQYQLSDDAKLCVDAAKSHAEARFPWPDAGSFASATDLTDYQQGWSGQFVDYLVTHCSWPDLPPGLAGMPGVAHRLDEAMIRYEPGGTPDVTYDHLAHHGAGTIPDFLPVPGCIPIPPQTTLFHLLQHQPVSGPAGPTNRNFSFGDNFPWFRLCLESPTPLTSAEVVLIGGYVADAASAATAAFPAVADALGVYAPAEFQQWVADNNALWLGKYFEMLRQTCRALSGVNPAAAMLFSQLSYSSLMTYADSTQALVFGGIQYGAMFGNSSVLTTCASNPFCSQR